jgi:hypothetical protein
MATTTNYGWTTPDDTALVKDGAAAIRTLGSSIDTTTKNLNPETTLADLAYRSSTANVKTRLGIGSTGQVLTVAGGVPTWATPAGGPTYAVFNDTKTMTSTSGTFTNGAFRTRDLQTTQINSISGASLASNQITLPAGTYYINAYAGAFGVNSHICRLQNITDSTEAILGLNAYNSTSTLNGNFSFLQGQITIAGTKVFELQHRCGSTRATDGFGTANNFYTEVYASIAIQKI